MPYRIILVRHGKTVMNLEGRLCGWNQSPLCEEGIKQLVSKRVLYKDIHPTYYYSSDLKRCLQTFELLFPNQKLKSILPEFREINFGELDGTYESQLNMFQLFVDFFNDENQYFEKKNDLLIRIRKGIQIILDDLKGSKHQEAIVVTHSALIMTILLYHYQLLPEHFYDLYIQNGDAIVLEIDDGSIQHIDYIKCN